MSKNTRWTPKDLQDKGLVENNGSFVPVKNLVATKVEKLPHLLERALPQEDPNKAFLDDLDNELSQNTPSRFKAQQGSLFDATEGELKLLSPIGFNPIDHELNNEIAWAKQEPPQRYDGSKLHFGTFDTDVLTPKSPLIMGADILAIRELTGKKQENAKKLLHQQAVEMLKNADAACYYIKGNTASSKNNKEIGRFKRRNKATGKMEDFNTLVDSKITQKYRKETAGYWMENKVAFLNETRNLPLPLEIEFTFIRDSLRRYDLCNAAQICCDMMVEYGWIPDDESVYLVPRFNKITYYHPTMAGVLIRVIH